MVFFTCNSCGQCVKKAHVEKHYLTECRNCEVLSCMDCGKDFVGDDYKLHTKCISENEKYGGKDYMASAKPNKGEVKQSQWIECVQAASFSQSVSPRVKGLLNRLADYNNIPRKKAKFEKFVQNSLKVWDTSLIEQIWSVFSAAGNKQQTQPEQKSTEESQKENEESSEGTPEEHSMRPKKKRKHGEREEGGAKDDRQTERGPTDEEGCDNKEVEQGDGELPKKKKKRKHDDSQNSDNGDLGTKEIKTNIEGQGDVELPKKKTKKKRDKNQCDGDSNNDVAEKNMKEPREVEGTSNSGVDQDESALRKKKKKANHKKHHAEEAEDLENVKEKERGERPGDESGPESEKPSKKSKKKKQHSSSTESKEDGLPYESTTEMVARKNRHKVNGEGEDTGLRKQKGAKSKEQVVDQPQGVKKRKRSSEKSATSDDSGMDGLLHVCMGETKKKRKTNKSNELKGGTCNSDESIKGGSKLLCLSEKKKKKKTNSEDTNTGQVHEFSEKILKKKTKDADEKSDVKNDSSSGKKKTKSKKSHGDGSLTSPQKEKKKKKLGDGGSEEIHVPVKKKKSKLMNVESKTNGGIEGKGDKKKKKNPKDKILHVVVCENQ